MDAVILEFEDMKKSRLWGVKIIEYFRQNLPFQRVYIAFLEQSLCSS